MGLWDSGWRQHRKSEEKKVWEVGYEQQQSFTRTFQITKVKGLDIHSSV